MTVIVPTFTKLRGPAGGIDAIVVTWAGFASSGDVGQAIQRPDVLDRSFQATGNNFGSGTIVCEGSNDGVNWFTLTNVAGGSISFTSAGLMQVVEATAFIRPHLTAGSSANVTATMLLRRTYR